MRGEIRNSDGSSHSFVRVECKYIYKRNAFCRAICIGNLVDLLRIHLAFIRKEEHRIQTASRYQSNHHVFFFGCMTHHPASAATLRTEYRSSYALDVSTLSKADEHRLILNKVCFAERLCGFSRDTGTTVITIFLGQIAHVILNQPEDLL